MMNVHALFFSASRCATRFGREQAGATAIEYGLIAGLISVAIIVALTAVGGDLAGLFNRIGSTLSAATNASS